VTAKANYPLPRIDACHDSLSGNLYFSSLNMHSSYWQVPIKEDIQGGPHKVKQTTILLVTFECVGKIQ